MRTLENSTGNLQWIISDHLGSTNTTANADCTLNSVIQYTAFGEIRSTQGITPTKYRYTGQLAQAELGLDYYIARWYDPSIMQFNQPDSLIPDPLKSNNWNRYSYAQYNPINYTDSTGHWVETALDIAFIAYDIYDIKTNGLNWVSGLSLAADVAGAILPVVTGAGLAVRALAKADDVVKVANATDKVIDTFEIAGKTDEVIDVVSHSDDLADALSHGDNLPDDALVCRAGTCLADQFEAGTGVIKNSDESLSNISVSSAPGKSLDELSKPFPNKQVGVTTVGEVRANGGNVVSSPSAGNPYHADLSGITAKQGKNLFRPTVQNPNRISIRKNRNRGT